MLIGQERLLQIVTPVDERSDLTEMLPMDDAVGEISGFPSSKGQRIRIVYVTRAPYDKSNNVPGLNIGNRLIVE